MAPSCWLPYGLRSARNELAGDNHGAGMLGVFRVGCVGCSAMNGDWLLPFVLATIAAVVLIDVVAMLAGTS